MWSPFEQDLPGGQIEDDSARIEQHCAHPGEDRPEPKAHPYLGSFLDVCVHVELLLPANRLPSTGTGS